LAALSTNPSQAAPVKSSNVTNLLRRSAADRTGATTAEYAVLTALLLPAVVAGISMLDSSLISFFTALGSKLTDLAETLNL
jgi:Flp pilus assembly pilin Flp